MKNKITVLKLFVPFLVIAAVFISIICYIGYVEKNVYIPNREFLKAHQPHSDKILFYDTLHDTVSFGENFVDFKNMREYKFSYFLYLYDDSIFFCGRSVEDKHNSAVYKTDPQLQNITEVLKNGDSYVMPNENTIIFKKDNSETRYVYYISENKTEEYPEDLASIQNQLYLEAYSNDHYAIEKHTKEHMFTATEFSFTITDRATGENRFLSTSNLPLTDIAPLNNSECKMMTFELLQVYLFGESIYVQVYTEGATLLYNYDFEKGEIQCVDWHPFYDNFYEILIYFIE